MHRSCISSPRLHAITRLKQHTSVFLILPVTEHRINALIIEAIRVEMSFDGEHDSAPSISPFRDSVTRESFRRNYNRLVFQQFSLYQFHCIIYFKEI